MAAAKAPGDARFVVVGAPHAESPVSKSAPQFPGRYVQPNGNIGGRGTSATPSLQRLGLANGPREAVEHIGRRGTRTGQVVAQQSDCQGIRYQIPSGDSSGDPPADCRLLPDLVPDQVTHQDTRNFVDPGQLVTLRALARARITQYDGTQPGHGPSSRSRGGDLIDDRLLEPSELLLVDDATILQFDQRSEVFGGAPLPSDHGDVLTEVPIHLLGRL